MLKLGPGAPRDNVEKKQAGWRRPPEAAGALHLPAEPHHLDLHTYTRWSGPSARHAEATAADSRLTAGRWTASHRDSVCPCCQVFFALLVIIRAWASPISAGSKSLRSEAWASVPCDLPEIIQNNPKHGLKRSHSRKVPAC